jgi:hypothetical protein
MMVWYLNFLVYRYILFVLFFSLTVKFIFRFRIIYVEGNVQLKKKDNWEQVHRVFWFWIVCEILEMPPDVFINIRGSIKYGYGWRWK